MNKLNTLLLALVVTCVEVAAQSISPQVLTNCGESGTSATHHMDWTFGEFAIATIGNGQHRITQGFHQPYSGTVGIDDATTAGIGTVIWPNPTQNELNVGFSAPTARNTLLSILGADGRLVSVVSVQTGVTSFFLSTGGLSQGSYLLRIDAPDQPSHTHRFVKTL